jgi:hypothetical protein
MAALDRHFAWRDVFAREYRVGFLVACLLLVPAAAAPAAAQFDTPGAGETIYELRLISGQRTLGWITETRGDTIVFRSFDGGEWRLDHRSDSLRRARGTVVGGEFWKEDQNQSRLFFAPTGRTLHQGQAYAGVFAVLPMVGGGITDDFTLAGGFNPFGGQLSNMALWVAPKLRVHATAEREASVGAFFLQFPENIFDDEYYWDPDREPYRLAIGYGVGTFGDRDRALHAGAGVARQFGSDARTRALGMVGGEYRIGRRWKLITENWLLVPDYPMVSLGFRSVGDRWTWDWGVMALLAEEGAPYMPIFSFSYAFGPGR